MLFSLHISYLSTGSHGRRERGAAQQEQRGFDSLSFVRCKGSRAEPSFYHILPIGAACNVWNIYIPTKLGDGVNVGKYSSTIHAYGHDLPII